MPSFRQDHLDNPNPVATKQPAGTVPITVDGKTVYVQPGVTPFSEIVSQAGLDKTTGQLDVVTSIGGNHSYTIRGGEVFESEPYQRSIAMAQPQFVTITINGKKYQVPPGNYSFQELAQVTGGTVHAFTVVTAATAQATVINGNDSFPVRGGEVLTSS